MEAKPQWRHMVDSDGSKISMLTMDYELWLSAVNKMSETNFHLAPGFTYLVPTYAVREIVFDQDENGATLFADEFAALKGADAGWNRPGAIADHKRGIVRWESPISKGVLQAKRSGKKGPWTVQLESPPIMGKRYTYKSPNTIPDEDFAETINSLFGWFNQAKQAVYSEWITEPFVIAKDFTNASGQVEMALAVFGEHHISEMWENVGKTDLGWFKVTTEDGMSPTNRKHSKLNMALLTLAFHESWLHSKIVVEGQAMSKNTKEHQWWLIEGYADNIKGFMRSAKRSKLHWVVDDQVKPGSDLLRVYLNIQPVEEHFVKSITKKLQLTPTMIENDIAFEAAPCKTNTTDLEAHTAYCNSCKTLRKNQAKAEAAQAAKEATEVVGSTDPRSGPAVTVQEPSGTAITKTPRPVEPGDLQQMADEYYDKAEFHQAEANRFLALAEKCELVLKPSTELQELRAKLEAAEKAEEDQRKKDLAEIEAAHKALV